jgi:hypothetical protein
MTFAAVAPRHGTPVVSVITPFTRRDRHLLLDAHASIASTTMTFEWLVQEDGTTPQGLPTPLHTDDRVRYEANGMHLGAAGTRNLALGRAAGRFVVLLDADDLLGPDALHHLVSAADHGASWVFGQSARWDPDDATAVTYRSVLPAGGYAAGDVPAAARRLGHIPLFSIPGLYRSDLLRRVGGWPALPRDEDVAVQLAATSAAPGMILDEVCYIARRHDGQATAQAWMDNLGPRCRQLVIDRFGWPREPWTSFISCASTSELYHLEPYEYGPAGGKTAVERQMRTGRDHV